MPSLAPASQYVLTIPFLVDPAVYVTVFVNGALETFWESMNDGLQSDDRIVTVRHGEALRGDSDEFRSDLSAHPLVVAELVEADLIDDGVGGRMIASDHKLGGRPYCIQEHELEGASPADGVISNGWVSCLSPLGKP